MKITRQFRIDVRMTEEEHAQVMQYYSSRGRKAADGMRELVLAEVRKTGLVSESSAMPGALQGQVDVMSQKMEGFVKASLILDQRMKEMQLQLAAAGELVKQHESRLNRQKDVVLAHHSDIDKLQQAVEFITSGTTRESAGGLSELLMG